MFHSQSTLIHITYIYKQDRRCLLTINGSGTFTLLVSLDFKLMNNFTQNTENASILNVPFHI